MRCFAVGFLGAILCSVASANTLYDAGSNLLPDNAAWGWTYASIPSGGVVTPPSGNGFVTLDTTASMAIHAGWLLSSPLSLDRNVGYDATWNLQLVSETHSSDNSRAGLSVIVLGNDDAGVEIGYWNNEIFAYNSDSGFSIGESAMISTSSMNNYDLHVSGSSYTLSVNGTQELTGSLRNYSAAGFPYNVPNALWVGDDTTRGESVTNWNSFSVTPAPEPAVWLSFGFGLVLLRRKRGSR